MYDRNMNTHDHVGKEQIINALNWRYAVKTFNPEKKVSADDLQTILESGRLAPSSTGIEPWKFLVVENVELRKKIREVAYDQTKVTDASHLIVLTRRTDSENLVNELITRAAAIQGKTEEDLAGLRGIAQGGLDGLPTPEAKDAYIMSQVYIALGFMIETAALLGIDTCPMLGFDPNKTNEILNLGSKNLSATVLLAVGHRGEDPYAELPKVRRAYSEVVETI